MEHIIYILKEKLNNMPYEDKPKKPLEHNDWMPSGKYSKLGSEGATKMIDVPAKYLLYVYENKMCSKLVKEYVEKNLDVIKEQAKKE